MIQPLITQPPTETEQAPDPDLLIPSYIGRAPCGCILGACVNDGTEPKRVAGWVASFVRSGLVIENVTVGYVRTHKFGCAHDTHLNYDVLPAGAKRKGGKKGKAIEPRPETTQQPMGI